MNHSEYKPVLPEAFEAARLTLCVAVDDGMPVGGDVGVSIVNADGHVLSIKLFDSLAQGSQYPTEVQIGPERDGYKVTFFTGDDPDVPLVVTCHPDGTISTGSDSAADAAAQPAPAEPKIEVRRTITGKYAIFVNNGRICDGWKLEDAAREVATRLRSNLRLPPAPAEVREGEDGASLIAAERQRQITAEGWTPEHDDGHAFGELTLAAKAYLETVGGPDVPVDWPWEAESFKPSIDPLPNLVKAGALIAAEIDRLQRTKGDAPAPGGEGEKVEKVECIKAAAPKATPFDCNLCQGGPCESPSPQPAPAAEPVARVEGPNSEGCHLYLSNHAHVAWGLTKAEANRMAFAINSACKERESAAYERGLLAGMERPDNEEAR